MHSQTTRRAARVAAAAVGGVLAAALAIPTGASATLYKAYDNGVLAYSTQAGDVRTIFPDGSHEAAVATQAAPLGVQGVAGEWSVDGNRLLLTDASKNLLDVNPWTKQQIAAVDEPFDITGPSLSPDGTAYAFGSPTDGVNIYKSDDGSTHQLLSGSSDGTAWDNDDHLVVAFDGNGVYRFQQPLDNLGTNMPANWVDSDHPDPKHVTTSRTGAKVAYTLHVGSTDDVYVAAGDGSIMPFAPEGATASSNERLATISPDGKKVAFVSDRAGDGTWSIYVRDLIANTTTMVPNTQTLPGTGLTGLSWQPAQMPYLSEAGITVAPEIGNTLAQDDEYDQPTPPYTTTWQWQRCTNVTGTSQYTYTGTCTDMPGETNAGYLLTSGDVGAQFRVVRTVTNAAGTDTKASRITEPAYVPDRTPPGVPTITTKPASPSKATSPTFAWTGAEAGGSFQCSIDNAAFTNCSSGSTFPVTGDTSHRFRVRQTDDSANIGDPAEYSWTLDTTPPDGPVIGSKPSGRTNATSARVTFTGDENDGSFECRLGSDGAAWSPCASPVDITGMGEGAKRFSIRQLDAAGNPSDPEVITWTVDTTAPGTPTITTKPSTRSKATAPEFAWTGAEADGTYECSIDNAAFTACTSGSTFPVTGETTHSFRVRQRDDAGNAGTAAEHTWTLDTTGPAAPTITTKPSTRSKATAPEFGWTGAEADGTYECSIDNAAFTACTSGSTFPVTGETTHSFRVRQRDDAGNAGTAAEHTWTLDTTGPAAPSVTQRPDTTTAAQTATIAFTGAEAGGHFECRDGDDTQPWATCTTPVSLTGRAEGLNRYSVRQVDEAGNAGTAKVLTWTVDLTAPAAPTFTQDQDQVHAFTTQYAFTGEDGATFECQLDTAAWAPCASPVTLSDYGTGTHWFRVRQTDTAGHTGPAAEDRFDADLDGPARPSLGSGIPARTTSKTTASFAFEGPGARYECRLDDGTWATCVPPVVFPHLAEGEHTFRVRGVDAYDIPGAVTTYTWTVDTTAPAQPTLTGAPAAQTTARAIDVRVGGIEDGATIECDVDGQGWTPCATPLKLDGFALGAHTLKLRQKDVAGNVSDTVSFAWTVLAEPAPAAPTTPAPAPAAKPATTPQPATTKPQDPAPAAKPKLNPILGDGTGSGNGTSSAATITVRNDGVGVGCSITGAVLTACRVDLYANAPEGKAAAAQQVLVGTGTLRKDAGSKKLDVDVTLNATGRALMRKSPDGLKVSVKITGTPVKGEKLRATGVATLVRQRVNATVGGFAVNSAKLTPAAKRQLGKLAKQVKGTAVAIRVVGHTDGSTDDVRYLDELGLRRAKAVAGYLRAHGVKAKATLVSRGSLQPKATNATAGGRAKNRRVELRIDR